MRISDEQIRSLISERLTDQIGGYTAKPEDAAMIRRLALKIIEMPDRDDMIQDLKARIQDGTYRPSAEEIADAMIRRTIADRTR